MRIIDGVNRDDVRMADRGRCLSFSQEASSSIGIRRQFRQLGFYGNDSVQFRIDRSHDNAHAAAPDFVEHFVGANRSPNIFLVGR